ncbi:MAG: ABC transporter ATP-binding protein [Candidatus Viridilinea halotolerans]|uniref:ABC transporter ATP-binding protein n=1 Tax=Candidatus Viridilinea halotolerans TaxID=2491704 RepID=A0A426TVN7_9CHLR|nr:MAG: ABC transporter ATP-binding protein [Candidatus Viridilinea halotolerans]
MYGATLNAPTPPFVEIENLHVTFAARRRLPWRQAAPMRAVREASLSIAAGTTFGLVGESGSGKSTIARALLRLLEPTHGTIRVAGRAIATLQGRELLAYRREVQAIFQDPYSALNPAHTVGTIVGELLTRHQGLRPGRQRDASVSELLGQVGLTPEYLHRLPRELSGGQRQRIAIARALAVEPALIVCDEPTSALDVSIQGQVINLLMDIQAQRGVTYLFIGHNLNVVRHISNNIGVMYSGYLVESGPAQRVYEEPAHPYTQMLLAAVPVPDVAAQRARAAQRRQHDEASTSAASPAEGGCPFQPRCPEARDICHQVMPEALPVIGGGMVRCHVAGEQSRRT